MRKLKNHSKSGLFLIEMILSLLFLALAVSVCIRIFAVSRINETKARNLNHIQELTVMAGEILEGTDGSAEEFLAMLPGGTAVDASASDSGSSGSENSGADSPASGSSLLYCYDRQWNACATADCVYEMTVTLSRPSDYEKKAVLAFLDSSGEILSETEILFPVISGKGGAA